MGKRNRPISSGLKSWNRKLQLKYKPSTANSLTYFQKNLKLVICFHRVWGKLKRQSIRTQLFMKCKSFDQFKASRHWSQKRASCISSKVWSLKESICDGNRETSKGKSKVDIRKRRPDIKDLTCIKIQQRSHVIFL